MDTSQKCFPKKSSHYFIHFSTVIWEQDSGTGQRHWKKEKEEEIVRKIVKETKRENIWILPLNIVASFIKPWKICFIFHLIQKYFRAFSKVGLMTVMFSFRSFFFSYVQSSLFLTVLCTRVSTFRYDRSEHSSWWCSTKPLWWSSWWLYINQMEKFVQWF